LSHARGVYPYLPFAPDPTGELTALPRPLSWFQGGRFAAGENGGKGREGLGEGKKGKGGEKGMGNGREEWEVGGIAPWLVGDRRH